MSHRIIIADVIDGLRQLDDESVQCIVTSPPYWNLRNYGTASWEGGDADCDHSYFRGGNGTASKKQVTSTGTQKYQYSGTCEKCGAVSVDRQIGLEPTISEYVEKMRAVFAECKRVLRNDGTLWLNLGDSYSGTGAATDACFKGKQGTNKGTFGQQAKTSTEVKPKDLCGIPWRVAFALQDDGWYLRKDIIWAKPNPMPESVRDRPTSAHEYIFLLTKSPKYFYDADAIAEPFSDERMGNPGGGGAYAADSGRGDRGGVGSGQWNDDGAKAGKNARSVWTIATEPYSGSHYAVFPSEIPRRCISAGSRAGDTVLDPFAGSGTTIQVAIELGRDVIGIDLDERNRALIEQRIEGITPPLPGVLG